MAQAGEGTIKFRRRLLGLDRKAVEAAMASTADRLRRAETRRDELLAHTANVERIGAQVADMLRSLADRAVELEIEAAATAAQTVQAAEREAEQIRASAAALLADAEEHAQRLLATARQQQATITERRETAVISLQIAIDQLGRLATTIDQIDLDAVVERDVVPQAPDTVVLLPWGAAPKPPEPSTTAADDDEAQAADDPIASVLSRMGGWASTTP